MEELIKWNYVVSRPSTKDELEVYECEYTWDGAIPEEDEDVIVSDGKNVWIDTWIYYDAYSCGFDNASSLEEFYWASIPKPPIGEVS